MLRGSEEISSDPIASFPSASRTPRFDAVDRFRGALAIASSSINLLLPTPHFSSSDIQKNHGEQIRNILIILPISRNSFRILLNPVEKFLNGI